jgi:hypothetical protein
MRARPCSHPSFTLRLLGKERWFFLAAGQWRCSASTLVSGHRIRSDSRHSRPAALGSLALDDSAHAPHLGTLVRTRMARIRSESNRGHSGCDAGPPRTDSGKQRIDAEAVPDSFPLHQGRQSRFHSGRCDQRPIGISPPSRCSCGVDDPTPYQLFAPLLSMTLMSWICPAW